MGKKEAILLIALVSALLIGCAKQAPEKNISIENQKEKSTETLNRYFSGIDYSCKTSSDCTIKDVRNCCGYYPQCVNKGAKTEPELVNSMCAMEGAVSICGFKSISKCECISNRCEGN
ncbi:hypothetical protein HYY72_03085 [Candidatus Woesearchaeota archaeon]|nr:hypothetical protein [Candidatus Woesearchaeota archaeon]